MKPTQGCTSKCHFVSLVKGPTYIHTAQWAYCPNKNPDSWVISVFPGAWRRVLEGACWGADVREDSKKLRDQERAWYKGWLGQAHAQTGGALLILKHTSFSNWPTLTQHVSNIWVLLLPCLSLCLCYSCLSPLWRPVCILVTFVHRAVLLL